MVEITEKWLMDCGGWQAVKAARGMVAAGLVSEATFAEGRLRGQVREGSKSYASGLLIKSRTDVTNLCTCISSRRSGQICAHAIAVGVAWLQRGTNAAGKATGAPAGAGNTASGRVGGSSLPIGYAASRSPQPLAAMADGALSFVFAANFFEGLKRGRLSVAVEMSRGSDEEKAEDSRVLAWIGQMGEKRVPPHLMLSEPKQIEAFFTALAGHSRLFVRLGTGAAKQPIQIAPAAARLLLVLKSSPDGHSARLKVEAPREKGADLAMPLSSEGIGWAWVPTRGRLFAVRTPAEAFELLRNVEGRLPHIEKPLRWLAQHFSTLQEAFELDTTASDAALLNLKTLPCSPQFKAEVDGGLDRLTVRLSVLCPGGPQPYPVLDQAVVGFPYADPANAGIFLDRNLPAEQQAARRLHAAGFMRGEDGVFSLRKEAEILQFFAGELERLKREWTVVIGSRFAQATARVERVAPQWKPISSGQDWLAFDLEFASAQGTTVSRGEVARLLASGFGHKRTAQGKIVVFNLDDAEDLNYVLRDIRPEQDTGNFRIKKSQAAYLAQSLGAGAVAGGESLESALAPDPAWSFKHLAPKDLQPILRSYQREGVEWLLGRASRGLGGILADEMGLGKTLQSLTLIAGLREKLPDRPALVVCPKSLLGNWKQEAARFTPQLKTLILAGSNRASQFKQIKDSGIVLTSYQLLARDIEQYQTIEWSTVILDEASFIRNPSTQAAKAARQLQGHAKFALTGTPIENGVRDLWSVMEFALPGYLGSQQDFSERYEQPMAATGPDSSGPQRAKIMSRLRRRLTPFLLRRIKQDVAKDLPSKIEKVHQIDLSDAQRDLYASILRESTNKIIDAENAKQQGQARMHMLTALLRLRQTCNDPRLLGLELPKELANEPSALSGKLEALDELLEEIRDGGHNVLIFSQFAKMLGLLKERLEAAGLPYCYLDGQTADRQAQVDAFTKDESKRAFLISLKAGGYGLNLTKADTVIHFDPWWNPAVEAQATDRAHRIGQTRPVTIYKFITSGTVEEKILKLQRTKRGLMDAAMQDDAPVMDGLSDAELRDLVMG